MKTSEIPNYLSSIGTILLAFMLLGFFFFGNVDFCLCDLVYNVTVTSFSVRSGLV